MTRVIPPMNPTPTSKTPKWLDVDKVVAATQADQKLTKQAATKAGLLANDEKVVIAAYGCVRCGATYTADHVELKKQANLASRAGQTVVYTCPSCGDALAVYQAQKRLTSADEIRHSDNQEIVKDLVKEASGTYNTFVDRHIVYKAVNALEDYALKQGMTMARAKYLRSEHSKQAGQEYPTLNTIACAIEWRFSKTGRIQAYANVSIDQAGNFKMPKVFTLVADQKVVPFEKDEIQRIEASYEPAPPPRPEPKKTDTPIYKRQDPSNFRAMANEEIVEKLVKESAIPQAPGAPQPPAQPAAAKVGDQLFNPADGVTYRLQTVTPGQGATALNMQTNQPAGISQDQLSGLVPAVKAGSLTKEAVTPEGFEDVVQSLKEESDVDNPWAVAWWMEGEGFKPHHGKHKKHHKRSNLIASAVTPIGYETIVAALKAIVSSKDAYASVWWLHDEDYKPLTKSSFEALAEELVGESLAKTAGLNPFASRRPKIDHVQHMAKRWSEIREELRKEARAPVKDKTGHDKATGLPYSEDRDIVMGLTEFPKDEKKEDSTGHPLDNEKGYRIPFKAMDDKQVEEREHFENEVRLPAFREQRREDSNYAPTPKGETDLNLGLAEREAAALDAVLGIQKHMIELATDDDSGVEKKPVEFKSIKKAPSIPEYKEPEAIGPAGGKAKEAITKIHNTQALIKEAEAKLQALTAPLMKQVADVSKPVSEDLQKQRDVLKKYVQMAYDELQELETKTASYEDKIVTAIERQKDVAAPANLAEVLAMAEQKMPEIAKKIAELVELIEGGRAKPIIEQLLYEYPVSKTQERKLKSSLEAVADDMFEGFLSILKSLILDLKGLNQDLTVSAAPAGA